MYLINVFVNCVGCVFVYWLMEEIDVKLGDIVCVCIMVCDVFDFDVVWCDIDVFDNCVVDDV